MTAATPLSALLAPIVVSDAGSPVVHQVDPDATRTDEPGTPLTLADGRAWHFAGPRLHLRPKFVESRDGDTIHRTMDVERVAGLPLEARRALADVCQAIDADPAGACPWHLIAALAVVLLRRCHDVTHDQAAAVLAMPEAMFSDFAAAVLRIALGFLPTVTPDIVDGPLANVGPVS